MVARHILHVGIGLKTADFADVVVVNLDNHFGFAWKWLSDYGNWPDTYNPAAELRRTDVATVRMRARFIQ